MSPAKKPPSPRLPCTGHQGESEEGSSKDHMATDGGERNAWSSISVMAKDRQKWRDHVAVLHATRRNGHSE